MKWVTASKKRQLPSIWYVPSFTILFCFSVKLTDFPSGRLITSHRISNVLPLRASTIGDVFAITVYGSKAKTPI